jgi:hypothetical protein
MLKKTLLSTLLTVSTLATAQINLDLNVTITSQGTEQQLSGAIIVDENVVTPIVFNGLETLVVGISAQTDGQNVLLQTQFFQKTDTDELEAVTELFTVQVACDQPATITVNDDENEGSLVLNITPSLLE